jgi:hypothetical protein
LYSIIGIHRWHYWLLHATRCVALHGFPGQPVEGETLKILAESWVCLAKSVIYFYLRLFSSSSPHVKTGEICQEVAVEAMKLQVAVRLLEDTGEY